MKCKICGIEKIDSIKFSGKETCHTCYMKEYRQRVIEIKKCLFCGKDFKIKIQNKTAKYCGKSCASKDGIKNQGIKNNFVDKKSDWKYNKNDFIKKVKDFIYEKNRYCTRSEIDKEIGIAANFWNDYKLSSLILNKICGFKKPVNCFEDIIYFHLCEIFGEKNIEKQKTFDGLIYKRNLRFDFYIKSKNILIEADGNQHWDKTHKYYSEDLKTRDSIKNNWSIENNILLIRIPYQKIITKDDIIKIITSQSAAKPILERSETIEI